MSIDLWEEGVIVEFSGTTPCHRAIIRSVGKSEVILADVSTGSSVSVEKKDLDDIYESGGARFLAESRDFGELKFTDLTEKEQKETNRKYKYIKKLTERGVTKITEKSSVQIIREVASELSEKPPHWQSVRSWYKSYVESGSKMRGLYPRHRFKGDREPKIDQKVLQIIKEAAKRYFNKSQPSMASVYRNVEDKIIEHNLDHPGEQLKVPNYLTVQSRVLETSYQSKQKSRQGIRTLQAELASSESGIETTRVIPALQKPDSLNRDWIVDKLGCLDLISVLRSNARKSEPPSGAVSMAGAQRQGYSIVQLVLSMQSGELQYSVAADGDATTSLKQFFGFKNNKMA